MASPFLFDAAVMGAGRADSAVALLLEKVPGVANPVTGQRWLTLCGLAGWRPRFCRTGYTMAVIVRAAPADIWPWLVQMGQGRGGFYTYEWVENLLGAHIHNANRIVPAWQHLAVGDPIRLTPDPYFGQPGQYMTVAEIQPGRALVFRQTLPNGSTASWAFVLRTQDHGTTRLLIRRRGGSPTLFDRVMKPGSAFMDRGMLSGIRARAEGRFRAPPPDS